MTNRKKILEQIIKERPDAVEVKNKYRVLTGMLRRMFPTDFEKIEKTKWEEIIFECVNADRDLRKLSEGKDTDNKNRLEEKWLDENYRNESN